MFIIFHFGVFKTEKSQMQFSIISSFGISNFGVEYKLWEITENVSCQNNSLSIKNNKRVFLKK